ncbi:MAG: MATE family efflux transporter [Treponema sp.]|nr:MATE family efflux transporter [Treponema sp.]
MIKNIDIFEKDPIPKAVLKLAVPTVLSMIVTVLYNMVDAFFVGMTNNPSMFAAVNVATPVFMVLMAAGNIFGMGGSSFLSRALGQKKYDKVKNISSFCFYAALVAGIIGGLLVLQFMPQVLSAIGTTEGTEKFAREYLTILAYGGPIIVISTAFTNIIRGEGASKNSMIGMMAGTIVNIILDPIFILDELFGIKLLGRGVEGAAIATLAGNFVTLCIYIMHVVSKNSVLTINPKHFKVRDGILSGVLVIGLPASLTNILMSVSAIAENKLLASYFYTNVVSEGLAPLITTIVGGNPVYGDIPVAAMGVALKANMLTIFIQLGLGMGISPLVGYNYGARNFKRMKGIMKFAISANIIAGTVLTILYCIFAKQIVNIFSEDAAVVYVGRYMIYGLMTSMPFIGILFCLNFTFQAAGKGAQSLILAVSRQGFVFFPMLFVMNHFFGIYGIVYAQPIADIVSVIMALLMFMRLNKDFREIEAEMEALQIY